MRKGGTVGMRKKDFKLYADECIEQYFVDYLREDLNFDIKSVREDGLQGEPDEIILKRANKIKRFLLTNNKKHFFTNDILFPFKGLFGIICLKFHKTHFPHQNILCLQRNAKQSLVGKKFFISNDIVSVRHRGKDSKLLNKKLYAKDCLLCKLDEAMENGKKVKS